MKSVITPTRSLVVLPEDQPILTGEATGVYPRREPTGGGTNLDSFATVLIVARNNCQGMNKVISRIKIDGAWVAQAVEK